MIQSIEIKNFKSIKNKCFPLGNLNLLLGLNGMGKSSFIQALLCLKQSANLKGGILDINNENYVKLGKTKDVLYQYCRKNENLGFDIEFSGIELIEFLGNSHIKLQFDYIPDADYFKVNEQLLSPYKEISADNQIFINEPLFTDNFQYLNANRTEPTHVSKQRYSRVVQQRNIGNHGEYTAHFIEVYGNEPIAFDNLLHSDPKIDNVTGKAIVNNTLLNQINLWMGEISPNVHINVTPISSEYVMLDYQFKQPNLGFTNRFKPENVGFGISYSLPIVVALLAAQTGELLIIENPESHIHPRGQAELGKLIALTAMNDVQIVIETHSDHILNGIRVAVKENPMLKDRAIIFYFDKEITDNEQYSKITDIRIDQNGELSDYPKDLLDEWSNQLFKLM